MTFRSIVAGTLGCVALAVGPVWLVRRRNRCRTPGVPLSPSERFSLAPWFSEPALDRVRVARGPVNRSPLPDWALVGPLGMIDFSWARGMAFIHTVVVADPRSGGPAALSLLFHQLVHVVQVEKYGIGVFAYRYIAGWYRNKTDYSSFPLEQQV